MSMSPEYINYCLSNLTDAELGAIVRKRMQHAAAEAIKAAAPVVEAQREQHEAEQVAAMVTERVERRALVYPEVEVKGVYIPALDLTEVTSLDEVPSAKQRSPYNKALYRNGRPLLESTATWREVATLHAEFVGGVTEPVVEQPTVAIVADNKDDSLAKSLASLFDISIEEAQQRLASY